MEVVLQVDSVPACAMLLRRLGFQDLLESRFQSHERRLLSASFHPTDFGYLLPFFFGGGVERFERISWEGGGVWSGSQVSCGKSRYNLGSSKRESRGM